MTNILKIAADLGIKTPRARPESEIFKCWRDRVLEASGYNEDIGMYQSRQQLSLARGARQEMARAIVEANAYAI